MAILSSGRGRVSMMSVSDLRIVLGKFGLHVLTSYDLVMMSTAVRGMSMASR